MPGATARAFVSLICGLGAAGCQTDRVIHRIGAFGDSYTQVVTRPYVYGGGEFCGSSVASSDRRTVWYNVFTRATAADCEALIDSFDANSNSRDPFPGMTSVLNCASQTGPFECERAVALQQDLAQRFAFGGSAAIGASEEQQEHLREFFASNGRLITRVLFGFDPRRPMSLECVKLSRLLDDDGNGAIDLIACRDATRSWVVDVSWTEV